MKQYFVILGCSLLASCGGGSSSDATDGVKLGTLLSPGAEPSAFSLDPYRAQNRGAQDTALTGTWVSVWNIDRKRSNPAPNVSIASEANIRRQEVLIIRSQKDNPEKFEVANCGGGFEPAVISSNVLRTRTRKLQVRNNKEMNFVANSSGRVRLLGTSGYTERTAVSAAYLKVSDSVGSLGNFSVNWSDTAGEQQKGIYCAAFDNIQGGYKRIYLGSDDVSRFLLSGDPAPTSVTALIATPEHKGAVLNRLTIGDNNFTYSEESSHKRMLNYSAINGSLSVTGDISVSIPR